MSRKSSHLIDDYWYIALFILAALLYYPAILFAVRRGSVFEPVLLALLFIPLLNSPELWGKAVYHVSHLWLSSETYNLIQRGPISRAFEYMPYLMLGWGAAIVAESRKWQQLITPLLLVVAMFCLRLEQTCIFVVCIAISLLLASAKGKDIIVKLGWLSGVMWLNHRMIFGLWFADFFYTVPPPINYVLLVILSAASAWVFLIFWKWLRNTLARCSKRR